MTAPGHRPIALERRPPPWLDVDAAALFIDLDGTLAHLADHPEAIALGGEVRSLLRALEAELAGRVAIVSGRSLASIDRVLKGAVRACAGVHGLVRRHPDGSLEQSPPHPGLDRARSALAPFVATTPGLVLEDKGLALALHYRGAPAAGPRAGTIASALAAETGLQLQAGEMVLELKGPDANKGSAVRAFMAAAPFAGFSPVFVGDDLTDEDGFAAAAALGGFGVLVGRRRQSHAAYGLASPSSVLTWLEGSLQQLKESG